MKKWLNSFVFLLSGCGLQIPDVPICRALDTIVVERIDLWGFKVHDTRPNPVCKKELNEPLCGFCAWTASDRNQFVGETKTLYGKPWSKLKGEALLMPTESLADIKSAFMAGCKKYGCSNADIAKWRIKLDSFGK